MFFQYSFAEDKTYSRNELPQLNQEIPENSNFNYELKSNVGKVHFKPS